MSRSRNLADLLESDGDVKSAHLDNTTSVTVTDNVTSTSTTEALSANQGKTLKDLVDGKQASDAQLTDVAGLAVTDGNFIVGNGSNFVAESAGTARTSLGLTIGTDVQAYDADLTTLATNGIGTSANQIVKLDGTAKLPAVDGSALTNLPASSEWITVWNHADDGNTTYVDFTTSESYTTLKGIELKLINVRPTSNGKLYLLPLNSSGSEIGTGSTAQSYSTSGSQVLLTTGGVKLAEYGVNISSLGVSGEIKIYWDYYSYNNRQWHGSCFLGYRNSTATAGTKFEWSVFMPNTYNGNTLTANLGGLRLNFTNDTVDYTFQDGCVLARLITK